MDPSVTRKILLAEDEAIIAIDEASVLEEHGFLVETVHTGEHALEAVLRDPGIGLVLMDIDLGRGISGTEAAEAILAKRPLPIVFLTSHAEREVVERVKGITGYGYVLKSGGEFVLVQAVNMAFELFDEQQRTRASEQRFRTIANVLPQLVSYKDTDLRYRYVNYTFESYFGVNPSELLGRRLPEVVGPDTYERVRPFVERALRGEKVHYRVEHEFAGKGCLVLDGTLIPDTDEAGRVLGFYSVLTDVTPYVAVSDKLAQNQRELERREELFRVVSEFTYDWEYWEGADESMLFVSPSVERITGYRPEQFLESRTFAEEIVHPADRERFQRHRRLHHGRSGSREFGSLQMRICASDGEVRWMHHVCRPVYLAGDEYAGRRVSNRDITEQRVWQDALRDSEEQYRVLVESSGDAIMLISPEFTILHANAAARALVGDQALRGRSCFNAYHGGSHVCPECPVRTALETRRDAERTKAFSTVAAVDRYFSVRASPVRDPEGLVRGVVVSARDVTEQYQLSRVLEANQDKTERLLEEKELLTREVQHRVKNDLELVRALLSLQADRVRDVSARDSLRDAEHRLRLMSELYDTLYRADDVRAVALRPLLTRCIDRLCEEGRTSGLRVETEIDDVTLPRKLAVSFAIVLNELLTNSLKYGTSDRELPVVYVSLRVTGSSTAEIVVSDNGSGLPEPVVHGKTCGFGLTVVQGIARQHGGTVRIGGGPGANVTVTLPLE